MTSTNNYKKKLIEVAIPLEAINAASIKEKSSPFLKGHSRSLHQWWARRPLAACRAILFCQLVDDPSSHPETFVGEDAIEKERNRLFKIVEDLVVWENSTNEEVLEAARVEIRKSCGEVLPTICDPFSGGGAIPLEAQRLGLVAFGGDLNPVAVMIGKAMVELPPKFSGRHPVHPGPKGQQFYRNAEGMAEDIRYYGDWMRKKAFERIGELYPQVTLPKELGGSVSTPTAWIWSRTVPSPDPAFSGVAGPIASSFALSTKAGKAVYIEPIVDKAAKSIEYVVRNSASKADIEQASLGTKAGRGANFRCLFSNAAITPEYVKACGAAGKIGVALIAIVAESKGGRIYVAPSPEHEAAAFLRQPEWVPEQLQPENPRWFSPPDYGMRTFGDLFTRRQLIAMDTLSGLVAEARAQIQSDAEAAGDLIDSAPLRDNGRGAKAYAEAVSVYLAFGVDKVADYGNSICGWNSTNQNIRQLFARQAIPMSWDFVEANPFGKMANISGFCDGIAGGLTGIVPASVSHVHQSDASTTVLDVVNPVISTDPPYYDNIGYADLSDFFYIWLRRSLKEVYPDLSSTITVPKAEELVATPYRHGGRAAAEQFFLTGMTKAISNFAHQSASEFPATIYYAFKQSEIESEGLASTGWATFLQAVISAGYSIVGTWPVRTERAARTIASGTNALSNSVVLVCRIRNISADVVSRAEFIRALKRELPPAIAELQGANIAPADMPQSAIGPGMGVFSRYKAVLESDDSPMSVKAALQLINRELDEYLGGIQGEFDADTRFAITWFEQHGTKTGEYGLANSIAQARGISVESVKHAGIVESSAGKVRILVRDELDADWDPASDGHLTVWECCQHLIRALETEGEHSAAMLLKKIGSEKADAVKDLAYCLYGICEKRSDAKDATSYNALIAVWTELTRQAAAIHDTGGDRQTRLDL